MVAVTLAALPIAMLVVWASLRSPLARLVVAAPSGERWHAVETPSVGGIGIFAGVLGGAGLAIAAGVIPASTEILAVLGGCALLFAAGLADDVRGLGPAVKLAAQLAAAALVLGAGVRVEAVNEPVLATAIGALWLVGMTNAMNLLDNMNGVAASITAVACGLFAIDAAGGHPSTLVLVFALAVGSASLGFLPFNLRPGRPAAAFMGDSGSQVLGFALGSLALLSTWKAAAPSLAAVLLPLLVLAIPMWDTAFVTILRLLRRRPVHAGGRDHTAHRLVYGGLAEQHAVVLLVALAAVVGATGLAYDAVGDPQVTIGGVVVTFAVLVQLGGALAALDAPSPTGHRISPARALRSQWPRALEVLGDFALVTAAFSLAYVIRFGGLGPEGQRALFSATLPVLLAARYATFIVFGLYGRRWRSLGVGRLAALVAAAMITSEAVAMALIAMSDRTAFATFSRSVFVLDALLCGAAILASRLVARQLVRPTTEPSRRPLGSPPVPTAGDAPLARRVSSFE